MSFQKILIAVDASPVAARAADVGVDLARKLGAEVSFITVVDPAEVAYAADSGVPGDEALAELRSEAKTLLNAFASRGEMSPVPLQFVEEGKPAAKIVEAAKSWRADLVIMGSHGRGAVAKVLLGSVAVSVLHHAPCPVMVVKAE